MQPFFTQSDKNAIELIKLVHGTTEYPDGWADSIQVGTNDFVTYTGEDCQPTAVEPLHAVIASPFDFSKS